MRVITRSAFSYVVSADTSYFSKSLSCSWLPTHNFESANQTGVCCSISVVVSSLGIFHCPVYADERVTSGDYICLRIKRGASTHWLIRFLSVGSYLIAESKSGLMTKFLTPWAWSSSKVFPLHHSLTVAMPWFVTLGCRNWRIGRCDHFASADIV